MKKIIALVLSAAAIASVCSGCAYGGVAVVGDKAVVARNDMFLFGLLRSVSVCKVADTGVTSCASGESP